MTQRYPAPSFAGRAGFVSTRFAFSLRHHFILVYRIKTFPAVPPSARALRRFEDSLRKRTPALVKYRTVVGKLRTNWQDSWRTLPQAIRKRLFAIAKELFPNWPNDGDDGKPNKDRRCPSAHIRALCERIVFVVRREDEQARQLERHLTRRTLREGKRERPFEAAISARFRLKTLRLLSRLRLSSPPPLESSVLVDMT